MSTRFIIIIGISALYGFFEVIVYLSQRRKRIVTKSGDKGSLWLLCFLISVGYFFSFLIGANKIGRLPDWKSLFAIGIVLITIGLIIRIRSILTLKLSLSYTVGKVDNHKLIETGLYKKLRHPGYLGQLIIILL